MKDTIKKFIEEGDGLWRNYHYESYENHIEDYYLTFTTKAKEINSIVKKHYKEKTGKEEDGAALMQRAFSVNNPVFPLRT